MDLGLFDFLRGILNRKTKLTFNTSRWHTQNGELHQQASIKRYQKYKDRNFVFSGLKLEELCTLLHTYSQFGKGYVELNTRRSQGLGGQKLCKNDDCFVKS